MEWKSWRRWPWAAGGAVRGLLLPSLCPVCRGALIDRAELACGECLARLHPLAAPRCPGCGGHLDNALALCGECLGRPSRPWSQAVSVFPYRGLAGELVRRLKYQGEVALVPLLATAALESWRRHGAAPVDALVPVPLHWTRRLARGYNQSELLAERMGLALGLPVVGALRRSRRTRKQAQLDLSARQTNVSGSFKRCLAAVVEGRHVLLVDDVMTTGATLSAAASVLREGGAVVSVLTIARG